MASMDAFGQGADAWFNSTFGTVPADGIANPAYGPLTDSSASAPASSPQPCFCPEDSGSGVLGATPDASMISSILAVPAVNPQLAPSDDPNAPAALVPEGTIPINGEATDGSNWMSGNLYRLQLVDGMGNPMQNGVVS